VEQFVLFGVKMRHEEFFRGMPYEFAREAFMFSLSRTEGVKFHNTFIEWPEMETCKPDARHTAVLIDSGVKRYFQGIPDPIMGTIDAQLLPSGKTRLLVEAEPQDCPAVVPYWELLRAELARLGWLDKGKEELQWPKVGANLPSNKKKGGARRLDVEERIKRLAVAKLVEENKKKTRLPYTHIIKKIPPNLWTNGYDSAGMQMLKESRYDLKRLKSADPDGILKRIESYLTEQKIVVVDQE
jgi:hypothetical protein